MSKLHTTWINFNSITRRWLRDGEDFITAYKTSPLEWFFLSASFVSLCALIALLAANRLDLLLIWASDFYEAIPKVFK